MAEDEKRDEETSEEPEESTEEEETEEEEAAEDADDADGSDDDESGDEGDEDEDEAEDDDDDEPEEDSEPVAAVAKPKRRKKTGRKKKGSKTTAGQRLAAAKAAKAARKAAARGKAAEIMEDKATERAEKAAGWFERNRSRISMGLAAAALILAGLIAWDYWSSKQNTEASTLLWEATQTLNAPIATEEDEPAAEEDEEEEESYETLGARADAALEKLDTMLEDHSGSGLAPYALLLRGKALYQKGEANEARAAFEKALAEGNEGVRARALEGIAFTYESDEEWDEAVARFEELREDDDLTLLADYHLARIHIARDQEVEAKEKLRAILDAFREEDAPQLPFVRDQAELRLMAIDSSLVQRDATPDQDEMRRLIEQLTKQQQAQGGG